MRSTWVRLVFSSARGKGRAARVRFAEHTPRTFCRLPAEVLFSRVRLLLLQNPGLASHGLHVGGDAGVGVDLCSARCFQLNAMIDRGNLAFYGSGAAPGLQVVRTKPI